MACNNNEKITNLIHLQSNLNVKYNYPIFSLKYLTTNKKYNFNGIKNDELDEFREKLIEKIIDLESKYTTENLFSMKKSNFFEGINYYQLKFNIDNIEISKDTKVYIFRVTSDYRMICVFSDVAPIFHIVGFDFRFNAYNHG